ncbi:MAG TPA: DUF433 domain-containing protein [Anaerolineales bacterium]|nr:DUF433 domain-containing protein [Anaerolineales bacterium]
MAALTTTEIIPLETDPDGVIRVSQTRVTLDTIVTAFKEGATAEEIAQQYPTVPLADVYYVIGYYLHRKDEVEVYLGKREKEAAELQNEMEARFNPVGIRKRLIAKQKNAE